MNKLKMLAAGFFAFMAVSLGSVASYALSPFVTQPQVIAPVQSVTMSCSSIAISSFSAVIATAPVVAQNLQRESLYIINISSVATTGKTIPASITFSGVSPSTTTAYGAQPGVVLAPHNWSGTTVTDQNVSFFANGAFTYQGALYAVAEGTGAVANICEFNP